MRSHPLLRRIVKRLFEFCRGLLYIAVLGALLSLAYLSLVGFPGWLMERVRSVLNSGPVAVEAASVRLRLPCSLSVRQARLFWKGAVGPPAAEAARLLVRLDPAAPWKGTPLVRALSVRDGVFRPELVRLAPLPGPRPGGQPPDLHLKVDFQRCLVWGQRVQSLSLDLHLAKGAVLAERIRGQLRDGDRVGRFSGRVRYEPATDTLSVDLQTALDPTLLLPLLENRRCHFLARFFQRFAFGPAPPDVQLSCATTLAPETPLTAEGSFALRDASYLGVPFRAADGRLRLTLTPAASEVRVAPLSIVRPEGRADGGFTVVSGPAGGHVDFDAVSSLDPQALTRMIDILTFGFWEAWAYAPPYRAQARGRVYYPDPAGSAFHGRVAFGSFGSARLALSEAEAELRMSGPTVFVEHVRGALCGGSVTGAVAVVLPAEAAGRTGYRVNGGAAGVDFAALTRLLQGGATNDYRGVFSTVFELEGSTEDPRLERLSGRGSVRVKDGRVFMLPLFGGFSGFMTRVIPGLDFILRQTDAKASFVIRGGRIYADRAIIDGDVLSLTARGWYAFDGRLDFDVQARLLKEHTLGGRLLSTAIYPLSKLLEMKLTGTLDRPRWRPANLPLNFLERLRGDEPPAAGPLLAPEAENGRPPAPPPAP